MERKLIALVLMALLGGMAAGYGLGYAIYRQSYTTNTTDQQEIYDRLNSLASKMDLILAAIEASGGLANVSVVNFPESADVNVTNFPNFPLLSNVYVTNFPLDAQGNIRITQMNNPQNITIIKRTLNQTLAYNAVPHNTYQNITTNLNEFNQVTIYVKAEGAFIFFNAYFGTGVVWSQIDSQTVNPSTTYSKTYTVSGPLFMIEFVGDGRATIAIYAVSG